ncbi:NADPH:quinone reductase [Halobacillus kuroshimensis]|uniref:NADPH:quinone reductase n=1 Tax=Halobacillus kuroshimensis TaxID=302481 RepID=A0ABS3DR36_9BACI|nr:NADPH:quinone reductase [Halobacillus kuroshimensis]MBN8233769.1 NADPH:quinone reductase [Halobacillus kuroshimensis]
MKAAWFEAFGAPEEVLQTGEYTAPEPGHGEVLIRMKTSGVNPSDTKKRQGSFQNLLDGGPVIPNSDGAGVIEAVGPGVSHARIGERVWVYQAQFQRQHGTAAEYCAVESRRAVKLPEEVSFETGACLGIPVMTAHRSVFADGPVEGEVLFITGGAGRVGYYAIQWAKLAGAVVITTASNEESSHYCREAGADFVVNHKSDDMVEQVLDFTGGRKVDRVIDVEFGANLESVLDIIRVGGVIATYSSTVVPEPVLPFKRMMFMNLTIRMIIVYDMPEEAKQEAIEDIDEALRSNLLLHRIDKIYPLEDIAEANALIDRGEGYGCVIVNIED